MVTSSSSVVHPTPKIGKVADEYAGKIQVMRITEKGDAHAKTHKHLLDFIEENPEIRSTVHYLARLGRRGTRWTNIRWGRGTAMNSTNVGESRTLLNNFLRIAELVMLFAGAFPSSGHANVLAGLFQNSNSSSRNRDFTISKLTDALLA